MTKVGANKNQTIAVAFDQLARVLGKTVDDATVTAVLSSGGKVVREDAGDEHYVICKPAGFELLLRGQRVHTIFMFSAGVRGHRGFEFPFGITAGPRKVIVDLLGTPSASWAIGHGTIPYTSRRVDQLWAKGASNRDAWQLGGFEVVVTSGPAADDRAKNPQRRAVVMAVEITRPSQPPTAHAQ